MTVLDKYFNKAFSVKTIILVVIIAIVLYLLPVLTPLVIIALILWVIFEKREKERLIKIQDYNTNQLRILLYRAYSVWSGVIGGPVKEISGEELMEEYKEKHEWNKYELEKLKDKKYKENLHDIDTIKNELDIVKSFYKSILHYSKDAIPEYKLEEWLKIAESKSNEIESFMNKKLYSIKDLIEIKDIFDTCHYFWKRMVLDSTRYNDTRSFSDNLLFDIKMLAKENKIKLSPYPMFYFFWTSSYNRDDRLNGM